jgi:hypothetical protein
MEREIIDLRQQVKDATAANAVLKTQLPQGRQDTPAGVSSHLSNGSAHVYPNPATEQFMGSHEAVASLLDLRSGYDGSNYSRNGRGFRTIEDVLLAHDRVGELFEL